MQALHDVRQKAASQVQLTCPDASTVQTALPPAGAVACEINVATTDARVTFNGTTPSSTNGQIVKKDQNPIYKPYAVPIKAVATAAAVSTIDVLWLY